MEAKGIRTDKGDLNRWVRSANAKLNNIRQTISELLAWLKEVKAELSKPQEPLIVDLLGRYFAGRNAGAWSQKAKLGNLKSYSAAVNYLHANNISTLSDLESRLDGYGKTINSLKSSLADKEQRIKELDRLFSKLYEDWAAERITEYNFKVLSEKYQTEQTEVLEKIERLQAELATEQRKSKRTASTKS